MRSPKNSVSYLLTDRLGSTSLTTNSTGAVTSELRYSPWGETRYTSGTSPTNYRYTGQRQEVSFGLYFYNARWYDNYLNHFTQPDSIVPDPGNSQDWDRYSYVNNNPIRYTDPTGHYRVEDFGTKYGCTDRAYCGDGRNDDNSNNPDRTHSPNGYGRSEQDDCLPGNLVACFYNGGVMPSGDYNITIEEYIALLLAMGYDIDNQGPIDNYGYREAYDTPFYNLGGSGGGTNPLSGTICIGGIVCRTRTELNYSAQGAWSAASMENQSGMVGVINSWKFIRYGHFASSGTIRSAKDGYTVYMLSHPIKYIASELGISNPISFIYHVVTGGNGGR